MSNIVKPDFSIHRNEREKQKKQKGVVLWFTGLSASGKTTTANELDKLLLQNHNHSYILDGDVFRSGLSSDLSFDKKSREENLRRIRHVAELFCDAGIVTIVTFISPFETDRKKARALLKEKYIEIFVKVSLGVAEKRDPKGLYKLAREGKLSNFTGVSSPYEAPKNPEIILDTEKLNIKEGALKIFSYLKERKIIV
jgi:adenylyl-sulfate kinase